MSKRKKALMQQEHSANISRLSHDGRGVAQIDGKTTFLFAGLADEQVKFRYNRLSSRFDEGEVIAVEDNAAAQRVQPKCEYFGLCGACQLQHMDYSAQLQHKQTVLLELLAHTSHIKPERIFPAISANPWGYRRKARLSVSYLKPKDEVLVGFRERCSGRKIARMQSCQVLHPKIGLHLNDLTRLVHQFEDPSSIPQFEVAVTDQVTAIIIRHLKPLTERELALIEETAKQFDWQIYLQSKGPDTIQLFYPRAADPLLSYSLDDYGLTLQFSPQQFTQVNSEVNPQMVAKAIELLNVKASDTVLDLFAGIGNFTLPLAKVAREVVAVEGGMDAVERGRANAKLNSLTNVSFHQADLFAPPFQPLWVKRTYNKLLLDPPRAGAAAIIPFLAEWKVEKIVYVSCHPATFARDCKAIVEQGYRLAEVGVLDMFAQTQHMEVMGLFVVAK